MRIHAEHAAQARAQRRPAEKVSALGGRADTGAPARHRLPAFANLQEALLENMIQNILVEASRGEVVLTSRPRVIALPPLSLPRVPTPDPPPVPPLGPQQAEAPHPMAPPPTDYLQTSGPSPSDFLP